MTKLFNSKILAFAVATSILGCKSGGNTGSTKDVGLSPADIKKPAPVVWQTEPSKKVHYSICPAGAASINRSCIGMKETFFPMKFEQYSKALIAAMIAARPPAAPGTPGAEEAAILDKIKRLNDKLRAGGLSASSEANFKAQVAKLQAQLDTMRLSPSVLTANENTLYDKIVTGLQAGKDITIDEGLDAYNVPGLPFVGPASTAVAANCAAGGQPIGTACWYKSADGDSCKTTCKNAGAALTMAPETVTYAGSGGTDANCAEVATAFGATNNGGQQHGPNGCVIDSTYYYRYAKKETTEDASQEGQERLCACK